MPQIRVETLIAAPQQLCFDLARDIRVHARTMQHTCERIVDGPDGLLQLGDTVVFEAKHFGAKQRLTATIVEMKEPVSFTDRMTRGAFRSLTHVHEFQPTPEGTLMIDTVDFQAPLGLLGRLSEFLFLEGYMIRLIAHRGLQLKQIAETGDYKSRSEP